MKKTILLAVLLAASASALADEYVQGYTKRDGTYVAPHYRTTSDNTTDNNYSRKGNTNPYTGEKGDVKADDEIKWNKPARQKSYYPN